MNRKTTDNLLCGCAGVLASVVVSFGFYLKGVDFTERGQQLWEAYAASLAVGAFASVISAMLICFRSES